MPMLCTPKLLSSTHYMCITCALHVRQSCRSCKTEPHLDVQLNYIAVIKSCKQRNRQLSAGLAPLPVPPLRAVELLSQQYFFTSSTLAQLSTEAEILLKVCLLRYHCAECICCCLLCIARRLWPAG